MALTEAARPTRIECLAAAAALEAALHMLDDEESAQVLAHLADEWRAEADLVLPESSADLASKLRQLADELEAEASLARGATSRLT